MYLSLDRARRSDEGAWVTHVAVGTRTQKELSHSHRECEWLWCCAILPKKSHNSFQVPRWRSLNVSGVCGLGTTDISAGSDRVTALLLSQAPGFSCWILEPVLLPWTEVWHSPASNMWGHQLSHILVHMGTWVSSQRLFLRCQADRDSLGLPVMQFLPRGSHLLQKVLHLECPFLTMLLLYWHLVPTHSVVVGSLMSPRKFHPKNQSGFFLFWGKGSIDNSALQTAFVRFCDNWRCPRSHWGVMLGWPQLCNAVTWNTVGFGIFYCTRP